MTREIERNKKICSSAISSTTNLNELPCSQTSPSTVRNWQLTACAIAWPENDLTEIGCENANLLGWHTVK